MLSCYGHFCPAVTGNCLATQLVLAALKGEGGIVNQTKIGTVSKATSGKLLRDGVERIRAFPNTQIPS